MLKFSQLPLRVMQEVELQQYKSELVVGAVQLVVLIVLFLINYVTPAGYSPNAPVYSASLGLSLFAILLLTRLWFAYTNQLSSLVLGMSVVLEMMLLLFIIWTYYLQYQTTPTINLKNSHLNFIYILITLRAFRFEPIWVLLSGFTAVFGWSLILWQTLASMGMHVITWDYVSYASSRTIYLGAVFDVLLSISLVTIILALVLERAKMTLFQAVEQTSATKDLSRFFDLNVAEKITHSNSILQVGNCETRKAAIMFTDLRGFTQVSKTLSPSGVIGLLREYQHLMVPIIQKHNGTIDKFMGDGIMASFGAVSPSEVFAADALRSVDEILQAVMLWNEKRRKSNEVIMNVGIGLAVGEVVFGVIGDKDRLEYTVIGEAANLAAKLEKHNKVKHTKALTTLAAWTEALKQGYTTDTSKKIIKAKSVAGMNEIIDLVILDR